MATLARQQVLCPFHLQSFLSRSRNLPPVRRTFGLLGRLLRLKSPYGLRCIIGCGLRTDLLGVSCNTSRFLFSAVRRKMLTTCFWGAPPCGRCGIMCCSPYGCTVHALQSGFANKLVTACQSCCSSTQPHGGGRTDLSDSPASLARKEQLCLRQAGINALAGHQVD